MARVVIDYGLGYFETDEVKVENQDGEWVVYSRDMRLVEGDEEGINCRALFNLQVIVEIEDDKKYWFWGYLIRKKNGNYAVVSHDRVKVGDEWLN